MPLPNNTPELLQEKLYDLNPNLKLTVKETEIIATAPEWEMKGPELQILADITKGRKVTFDRSGANFRMKIC
jgi:hypothetical protein